MGRVDLAYRIIRVLEPVRNIHRTGYAILWGLLSPENDELVTYTVRVSSSRNANMLYSCYVKYNAIFELHATQRKYSMLAAQLLYNNRPSPLTAPSLAGTRCLHHTKKLPQQPPSGFHSHSL